MLSNQKNSEALANFSEQLDIEGRSLWQDARRRFMHNRAAIFSLCVLFLITLFVIFAPMLSPFLYDDTDWEMMSMPPDMATGHYFGTDASGRDLLVRVAIGGRCSCASCRGGRNFIWFISWLCGWKSGFHHDEDIRNFKLLPIYVFCDPLSDLVWYQYLTDLCGHWDGVVVGYGAYCSRANTRIKAQRIH